MATDVVVTRFVTQGLSGLHSDLRSAESSLSAVESRAERVGRASSMLMGFGAAGAGALALLGKSSLEAAGNLQRTEAGLKSLLGSSEAAKSKMKEIAEFGAASPFSFEESAKGAQQLLALGFAADSIKPTLNAVGNAVAAVGGNSETLGGVITALGQIESKGKLSQEEALQIAERGIPIFKILQKELGLTKEQIGNLGSEGIESSKAIAAILKGMQAMGGGIAMEEQMKTLPGQMSTLEDSAQQLKATLGSLFTEDATKLVSGLNDAAGKLNEFVKNNPTLAKGFAGMLGVGALGVVGAGVAGKAAGIYNEIAEASERARQKKEGLAEATDRDAQSERRKATVAIAEAGAIRSTGSASEEAARSKGALSVATDKLSKMEAARIALSTKLAQAQQKLSKAAPGSSEAKAAQAQVETLKGAIGRVNAQAKEARSEVEEATEKAAQAAGDAGGGDGPSGLGAAALAALTGDTEGATDAVKAHFEELAQGKLDEFLEDPIQGLKDFKAQGLASVASVRAALARPLMIPPAGTGWLGNLGSQLGLRAGQIRLPSVMGAGGSGSPLTGAGAAFAGANGLLAGYEAQKNWEKLGYSQGQSMSIGIVTGLGTAAVTALNPAAGALILAASALSEGVEHFYSKPMEEAALKGSGMSDEEAASLGGMTSAQRAQKYKALAEQKRAEGDTVTAQSFDIRAKQFEKQAAAESTPAAQYERWAQGVNAEYDARRAQDREAAGNDGRDRLDTSKLRADDVVQHRNGARTVTIRLPESPGDKAARQANFNRVTSTPNLTL